MNYIKNYLSTSLFIIYLLIIYKNNNYLSNNLNFNLDIIILGKNIIINDFLLKFFILYIFLLIPYYYFEKEKSKVRIIFNYFSKKIKKKKYKIKLDEKNAFLGYLVKIFYAPLMLKYFISGINNISFHINNFISYSNYLNTSFFYDLLKNNIFPGIISFIFLVDLTFFTLGYLLEGNIFKNKIKSVEPTIFGWLIALICYEPFNQSISKFIGSYLNTQIYFGDNFFTIIFNIIIIILLSIYSRASLSLGLKASNLTNRGIVKSGPYKYIRHPAYLTKNLTRWICAIGIIYNLILQQEYLLIINVILSLSIWSSIYYFRAITEEDHLSQDKDYIKYKKIVKNRFFPNLKK